MAESNKKGMISGMDSLVSISGEEYLEVIRLETDGSYKNYKLLVSKIRNNQGLSAYEIAVQNGFVGTVDQWLASLNGKSAYEIAVELGFSGDEAAFILSLKGDKGVAGDEGKSIYDIALANGFIGTEADFLKTLIGKSAYQSALDQGFVGTEADFVLSLKGDKGDDGEQGEIGPDGKSAFQVWQELPGNAGKPIEDYLDANKGATGDSAYEAALALNPDVGTEAEWLASLVGKSAYEVALAEDPDVGTPAEWLLTLKGDNAYQVAVANGFVGTEAAWLTSLVGKSAYQSWLAEGNVGTEAQFLASLEGSDGTNGTDGEDGAPGKSAYEVWKELPGNTDKTEAEFIVSITGKDGTNGTDGEDGAAGLSAYQTWLTLPGNAGKSEAEFIASIKGAAGEDGEDGAAGKSAYQLWLDAGNTGTEAQFLTSLVGADGKQGPGVKVVATVEQDEFDQIVQDGLSEVGDAYLVGVFMHIFNGEEWVKSNAIQGPKGQGLNYLGTWPTGVALPLDSNYKAGDTYVWAAPTKGNSLWTLVVEFDGTGAETSRQWVDIGVPGPEGKSAYETWKGLPGNANKTEAEFIASIKGNPGTDGTNGTNGKSAYQSWLDAGNVGNEAAFLLALKGEQGDVGESAYEVWLAAGNTGTEADYLLAIKGDKGDQGTAAVAFTIKAKLEDVSELPAVGTPTEAYYVKKDLYVWIADSVTPANSKFENFGSLNGASAYEIWVEQPGNAGKTIEEFLASLRGTDGTNGTDGVDGTNGKNLQVLGRRADLAAIQAIPDPQDQDAYTADDNGHLYIYVVNAWVDAGKFRGADGTNGTNGTDGTDGVDGKSAYEIAQDGGFVGSESAWLVSLKGADGTNGRNVLLKGAVADVASLPVGAAEQDAYSVTETNTVYMWIDGAWVNLGSFKGTNGTNGKSAYQTWVDAGNVGTEAQFLASLKGTNGTNGTDGQDGADGRNVTVLGSKATLAIIQALPTPAEQDAWTSLEDSHLYMYIGTTWVDLGQFKGDKGDKGDDGGQGATGTSINIKGEVELDADLPAPGTLTVGDAYFSLESRKLYQVNEGGLYNPGIDITGPQGEQGIEGPAGQDGKSISIMGSYATEAALIAAHPTGVAGEGYLVGFDLYLYGVNPTGGATEWFNAGPVRGPIGPEGKIGKTGLKGNTGNTGERGSLWLTLETGLTEPRPDYGRDGDWAVSESFETFYKAPGTGWAPIGRLVAGDVNSPPGGLGKVVRMGTQWVPLPVDEVPNLATGKVYARQLKAGSETNEGEWVEIVFPDTFPETTADGKDYVRTRATGQAKGEWKELVFPASIPDLTVKDGKQMVRVFEAAGVTPIWKELSVPAAGIPEAPNTAGKLYVRSGENTAWVEYAGISAPVDATGLKKFIRTATEWVAFDAYDIAVQSASASANFDVSKSQMLELTNTAAGAKTVTFTGIPKTGRATTVVVLVKGSTGAISFAGLPVKWNGQVDPVLQAGDNVLTFLIVGNDTPASARAIGAVGSQTST